MSSYIKKYKKYCNYLKELPNLNKRPSKRPPQTRKGALIWKFAMSVEALIQIVCKNDETRVFFSQIFFVFYNKEIYKHILLFTNTFCNLQTHSVIYKHIL